MKKWRKLTDKEIQAELQQIALEQEMLSGGSYSVPTERSDESDDSFSDNTDDDSIDDNTDDSKFEQPSIIESE